MNINKLVITAALLLALTATATSQSTIANMPSTDVNEQGSGYVEVNFGSHFAGYSNGGFQAYGLKALYGVRRNVEIGANLSFTKVGGLSPVEFMPNLKWKAYNNEKRKIAVSGGVVGFIPLRAEPGTRPTAMVYSTVSKSFDQLKGFRLTAGGYAVAGAKSDSGNRKGVMFGYEQTVFRKISFFADWSSGRNRFAYTGVGLSIPFKKKHVVYTGYNFGNSGRGNNWLAVTYGRFF